MIVRCNFARCACDRDVFTVGLAPVGAKSLRENEVPPQDSSISSLYHKNSKALHKRSSPGDNPAILLCCF